MLWLREWALASATPFEGRTDMPKFCITIGRDRTVYTDYLIEAETEAEARAKMFSKSPDPVDPGDELEEPWINWDAGEFDGETEGEYDNWRCVEVEEMEDETKEGEDDASK